MKTLSFGILIGLVALAFCSSSEAALSSQQAHLAYQYFIFQKSCVDQYNNSTLPELPVQCAIYVTICRYQDNIPDVQYHPHTTGINSKSAPNYPYFPKLKCIWALLFWQQFGSTLLYYGQLVITNLTLAYGLFAGFSVWIYGQNILLSLQNLVILLSFFKYSERKISELVPAFLITMVISAIFIGQVVPGWCQQASIWFQLIIFFGARGSQILKNYQLKTTKNLSTKTMIITLFANFARTFTILVEAPHSVGYLMNYFIPIFVNSIIVWQIHHYDVNKSESTKDINSKKSV